MMDNPLDAGWGTEVVLLPGERLTGTINLDCYASSVREALAKGEDVVVNWRYAFKAQQMANAAPIARGSVVLRAAELGNSPPAGCR